MADFAPPAAPPPPKVPEGWKAVWNDQYNEYFYVNIYTRKSQWDKPESPVYPPGEAPDAAPGGPPPYYDTANAKATGPEKGALPGGLVGGANLTEDERLARQLQEEENARAGVGSSGAPGVAGRGAADSYYNDSFQQQQQQPGGYGAPQAPPYGNPSPQPGYGPGGPQMQQGYYPQGPSPGPPPMASDSRADGGKKGLLGKLLGGGKNKMRPPQQQGYGYQNPYAKPPRPGMGTAGAAGLGAAGGLAGGMLLGSALSGHHHGGGYGGDDGGYYGGDDGGHYGGDDGGFGGDDGGGFGGDDGGGFGGDDGGGDFGGGDFGGD